MDSSTTDYNSYIGASYLHHYNGYVQEYFITAVFGPGSRIFTEARQGSRSKIIILAMGLYPRQYFDVGSLTIYDFDG